MSRARNYSEHMTDDDTLVVDRATTLARQHMHDVARIEALEQAVHEKLKKNDSCWVVSEAQRNVSVEIAVGDALREEARKNSGKALHG